MSGPSLAAEMREAALDIQRAAQRTRCYSVIQHIVTAATEHISAAAGNAEKNERITALEAESVQAATDFASLQALFDRVAGERDQARECLDQQRDNYGVLLAERDALRKALEGEREECASLVGAAQLSPHGKTHAELLAVQSFTVWAAAAIRARSLLSEGGGE